jgi:glyoxylase-like metal-dependent hydrolase (beta-lactamase superfamily II)
MTDPAGASILEPRVLKAGNRGPFTLDGTRSFLVGQKQAVVIDPGPDVEEHVRALSSALRGSAEVRILLTHGHSDHAGAATALAEALGAPIYGPPSTPFSPITAGDPIPTDEGDLTPISTPGHTSDHLAFFWSRANILFAGDLLLGRGSTTWLGEYPGCVADYLASLEKVEAMAPVVIYPAHGAPPKKPLETLRKFRNHRMDRLRQLRAVTLEHPGAGLDELVKVIYGGDVPSRLAKAAYSSIEVMLHHLDTFGDSF